MNPTKCVQRVSDIAQLPPCMWPLEYGNVPRALVTGFIIGLRLILSQGFTFEF